MLLRPSFVRRRLRKSSPSRILLTALLLFLLDAVFLISQLPASDLPSSQAASDPDADLNSTVFLASIDRHSAPRLHTTWFHAVIHLTQRLGPRNVHVSIAEAPCSHDCVTGPLRYLTET